MQANSNPIGNRLLTALPTAALEALRGSLETVDCPFREILVEADSSLSSIHFPDSGVVSMLAVYPDGKTLEMATIGREGCTGVQAVLGATASSARLMVQVPGRAHRMSREAFDRAIVEVDGFRQVLNSYLQAFLEQILISGGCNGAHNVKQRLARWILMMRDRHDNDTLPLTHDLAAEMLGVHRPTVTTAMRFIEKSGLVEIGRRRVTILDRDGLTEAACECYQIVRKRTAHYLPKTYD